MKYRSEVSKGGAASRRALPARETLPKLQIAVPSDISNEMVLLAAMMVDDEVCDRLLPLLPADAFYAEEHRLIRNALAEMRKQGLSYDPATASRFAPDVDARKLSRLPAERPDVPVNLQYHVDALLWDWTRAQVTSGPLASLLEAVQNPLEDPDRIRALAKQVGSAFDGKVGKARFIRDGDEVVRRASQTLSKRINGEANYPFGIEGLDFYSDPKLIAKHGRTRCRPGMAPEKMTLVTASSGSGKTSLICRIALEQAKLGRRVLFGSWEEDASTTLESLAVLHLGWSRSRVLDGKGHLREEGSLEYPAMTREEIILFEETCHDVAQWVTFFDNPFQHGARMKTGRSVSNDDHLDIVEEHVSASGCDVAFFDLLHRCFVHDSPTDEKLALYRMLSIAEGYKIHVCNAHQQHLKGLENRADKRPSRETIIGSQIWVDIHWTVLAPYLAAKWKAVPDDVMEIILLKQRNGPWPLAIEFGWNPDAGAISGGKDVPILAMDSSDGAFGVHRPGKKKNFSSYGGKG